MSEPDKGAARTSEFHPHLSREVPLSWWIQEKDLQTLTLPEFSLIANPTHWRTHPPTREVAESFQRIFSDEHFDTLLIEIAAVVDERLISNAVAPEGSTGEESDFVSHIFTFEEDPELAELMADVWDAAVKKIIESSRPQSGANPQYVDFVPHPNMYGYLSLARSIRAELHPQVLERIKAFSLDAESELNLRTRAQPCPPVKHSFKRINQPSDELPGVESTMTLLCESLVGELSERAIQGTASQCKEARRVLATLLKASVLIVPFFRQIEYRAGQSQYWNGFGGNPGGCLLAVVVPQLPQYDYHLPRAAVRASWLLQQAALREGDSNSVRDRQQMETYQSLLGDITHAVPQPISTARVHIEKLWSRIEDTIKDNIDLVLLFRQARAALRLAEYSARAVDFFFYAGKAAPPQWRERYLQRQREARTQLDLIFQDIGSDFLFKAKPLEVQTEGVHSPCYVEGERGALGTLFWLLLKNAAEASQDGDSVIVVFRLGDARHTMNVSIENRLRKPLTKKQIQRIEDGFVKGRQSMSGSDRSDGRGIGLVTAHTIIDLLHLQGGWEHSDNKVTFHIRGIQCNV